MKTILCMLLPALLAACASSPKVYEKSAEAIRAELDAATAKPAERPGSGLYPSLRLDMPEPVAPPREQRFDLVVNDAPVRQVLLSLVADTPYSMLLPNDLDGRITVSLKNVTMSEALSSLRQLYGYEYRVEGQRIFIQSRALQTRIMKVNYLNAVRRGSSDIRVISGSVSDSSGSTSTGTSSTTGNNQSNFVTSKITTTSQSDFWGELQAAVKSIIGSEPGRSVVVSPQSGVLVVRALPGEIAQVERFLAASQLSLERQVIIEAKIMEVTLSNQFQAGINWAAFGGSRFAVGQLTPGSSINQNGTLTTNPISGNPLRTLANAADAAGAMFGMVLRTANFAAVINLLEEQGQVHVLSSPRVATLNNQKAVLKVGSDDFFVTGVSSSTTTSTSGNSGNSTSTPNLTLQPFFSGIALDVTPQIDDGDQITLHVHPMVTKVSSVIQEVDLGTMGKFKLPLASSQVSEMDSVVRALDGQMIALGGLIRQGSSNSDSQVPGIGSVPIVGNLFKQQGRDSERRELVILLRPTIVQAAGDWDGEISQSKQRMQRLLDEPRNHP